MIQLPPVRPTHAQATLMRQIPSERTRMPKELSVALIVVSRHENPPGAPVIARALASAGLGVAEYQPASPPDPGSAPPAVRHPAGTHVWPRPGTRATPR